MRAASVISKVSEPWGMRQFESHAGPGAPLTQLAADLVQDHLPERDDQPAALGDAYEGVGRERPPVGVLPADQSLEGDHVACPHVHDRLVVQPEITLFHRGPQFGFGLDGVEHGAVHALVEDAVAGASGLLGLVHGGVGGVEQIVGIAV
jgi:hypothetical protein